jgi:hypothetical protein
MPGGAPGAPGAPGTPGGAFGGTPQSAAVGTFQASPGYQWQLGQGLDALARQRAIGGMGASGNADIDAMTYGTGLANQSYQQWINNLQNAGQLGASTTGAAAAGQAAGYGSLANLAQQYGSNVGNVMGNVEQQTIGANNLQAAGEAAGAKNLLGAGLSLASIGMAPFTGGASLAGLGSLLRGGGGPMTLGGPSGPTAFTSLG